MAVVYKEAVTNSADIVQRYTDQPSVMPGEVRNVIETQCNNEVIQLYALADLNASMQLVESWVAITRNYVAMTKADRSSGKIDVKTIPRNSIHAVVEQPGLSSTTLILLAEPDQPALAVVHYTHRQRRAMENIKFILEQQIANDTTSNTTSLDVTPGKADAVYSEAVAEPIRIAQASISQSKAAVILRLLTYLKPYRFRIAMGMSAAFVMTGLSLLSPYLTKYIIDKVYQPFTSGLISHEQALQTSITVITLLAIAFALREICHWVRLRVMSVIGEYVAHDIRRELYSHMQQLSLSFFSKKQTGSLISRVSHDTDRLWDFLAFGIVEVTLSITMLIGLSVVLIVLDWRLGLMVTLPVPFLLLAFIRHSYTLQRYFTRAWRKWSNLTEVLSDTIPGIRVVKAFNQEQREIQRFNERNTSCLHDLTKIHTVWTRFWPRILFALHILVVAVWAFALPRLFAGTTYDVAPISIGTFLAFLLYLGMFFQPIETIGMMTRMLNRATTSALRVFEILDTNPELTVPQNPVRLTPIRGRVSFEDVTFSYDGIRQVLKGVSFVVEPGEMIGLVGPSGAGKSTIINLIVNFYAPSGGRIKIDGVNLAELDIGHFRKQVGMVLQDPHLFHGTIVDNIRYGLEEASYDRIIEAARAANAHDFILKLPHGYETVVGERGHTLSGGERQRISIARAILSNPRILILDEATSSVDTETERKIQEALERLIKGRTVFAIAHRLSTLRKADRLFVIEDGKITEEGTHQELLKLDGTYRRLSSMQRELHEIYAV
jgi:ATP-binding cassette subfamily B protein